MSKGTPLRCLRIPDDFWAEVKAATSAEGIHISDLIRWLLRGWLDGRKQTMSEDLPYPDEPVTCACGETFRLYWNGGELDQHDCKCGRKYYGEHRDTVMVVLQPGESPHDPR